MSIRNAQVAFEPVAYQFWIGTYQHQGNADNQSGSGPNAYSSLQAAISAASTLPAGSDVTFHLTKQDYTGEGAIDISLMDGMFPNFVSEVAASAIAAFTGVCTTGAVLTLRNIGCGSISTTKVDVRAFDCSSLGNMTLIGGNATLDNSQTGNLATPDGGLTIRNNSLIEGNVTALFVEHVSGSTFGTGGEDPLTFALDHTQDSSRGGFQNCNWLSPYSYQNGTGEFISDDVSLSRFVQAFGGFVDGTTFVRYDFTSSSYTPVLTSTNSNASIGNGVIAASCLEIGDTILVQITFNVGSTTNFGTGNTRISLPADFTAVASPAGQTATVCMVAAQDLSFEKVSPVSLADGRNIEFQTNMGNFGLPVDTDTYFQLQFYANRISPP